MNPLSLQALAKTLIQLKGLKAARLAAALDMRSPNLYNWFAGRSQTLSVQMVDALMRRLGVVDYKLSSQVIHCWQVDESLEDLKLLLLSLVDTKALSLAEIYYIDCGKRRYFNLIRIPNTGKESITLLISAGKTNVDGYPLNASKLGFGIDKGSVELPHRTWEEWWLTDPVMTATDFWISARPFLGSMVEIESPVIAADNLIDMQTKYEREIIEQTAVNAGLRGLIRALLGEVRELDSKNALLKHAERDKVYDDCYLEELGKLKNRSK